MMDHTGPFDGVAHLVADLSRRGLVWGVVTNKSARFAEPLTRALDLFAGASVLVCGDTTPHTKPHPAPLLEAARRIGYCACASACTWGTTTATSWPGGPLACDGRRRPMGTSG
jgi:phosphoglycolate phosphatase-like HAD superfamily hydrolase